MSLRSGPPRPLAWVAKAQTSARRSARVELRRILTATVLVSALGYFVDVYDLLLFSIVRVESLRELGVADEDMLSTGVLLLNWQMAGLLLGGIAWGVLGDKRGRVSVLFGSIALYSIANIANAFVTNVPTYAALRFLAGLGLAGELGAAVTLVTETLPKETRGYGTAIVASFGLLGAVVAALVGGLTNWRIAFAIGGVLGLMLLGLRFKLRESGMFDAARSSDATRGSLRHLLGTPERRWRYMHCILLGMPVWFAIGVLVTFSPEFGLELGITGAISAGTAVLVTYAGGVAGDLASGFASQRFKSRQWVLLVFIGGIALAMDIILIPRGYSSSTFYVLCAILGFFVGYWAVFVTQAAEQFGTNLRATVATTVPNLIRGSVVPLTLLTTALRGPLGLGRAALIVGAGCCLIALWSLRSLKETYGADLDYLEA